MASLKEKKKMKKTPPLIMVVVVSDEQGENFWDLDEMKFVVYRSCPQRPKEVVFERLSEKGLVMEVENDEEEEERM